MSEETPHVVVKHVRNFKFPFIASVILNLFLAVGLIAWGIGGYLLYSNAANQVAQLTADKQAAVDQLAATKSTASTCADQTVDIVAGKYTLPCTWHSYFESRPTEALSIGYANDGPIFLYGASDAPVGKVSISLQRYSNDIGNYKADPLSDTIATDTASGAVVTDVTSAKGIVFKKEVQSSMFASTGYYAQKTKDGVVYVVGFFTRSDKDYAVDLMNSFEWEL